MKIRRPVLTAWLLLVALFVTACSSSDAPPATTTTPPAASNVVANAGSDQNVVVGSFITLNGSKSTTTNSLQLSYTWSMTVRPAGSTARLSDANDVDPTFTTDVAGTYECELVVSDGQETSSPDKVTITATAAGTNPPPVANAGPNRSVFIGKLTSLDGRASTDQIGDPLKYRWTFTGRPPLSAASLVNADKVNPSFTPDVAGLYVIQLVVNDGTSDSAPASVNITVSTESLPTAKAGLDQIVLPNSLVTLDGSESSDAGGDIPLKYQWSLSTPAGVTATLNNPNIAKPTFTPPVAGAYTAQLIVTDSTGAKSAPDTVLITVGPRANAGPVQTVSVGATVQLNGSGSFGAAPLSYSWTFTAPLVAGSTAAFLPNNTVVDPTFVANVAGTYMIRLTVTDSVGRSAVATTTVTAQAGPTANFTFAPSNPDVNTTVQLTNTSTGSSLAYTWEFTERPTGSAAQFSPNASATNPTFVADRAGDFDVKLTARNTITNATVSKTQPIVVKNVFINTTPTAVINVTSALPANVCSTVKLSGTSSSDPGGIVASYLWTLTRPNGSAATLSSNTSSTPEFKADKAGTFGVRLVVTDDLGAPSPPANMNIAAQPNAIGKAIYDTTGLPGMTPTPPVVGGPKCMDCHKAGNHDTVDSTFTAADLSLSQYTVPVIKSKLTTAHLGGKTNLGDPELTQKITALRQFLDSTLTNCP
ncbi:MAG: PKD domain-containing protein [Nitrospirales bacterium]